ncbi:hypothetical protein HHI36_023900 [Cryptolaemus montrouzieri]|uniref:Uncharacterized protein n=1 Tax=Cryptolaemus montrouzieri TaxID=559131 RepID=A0ABD2NPC9_9CUCU
MAHAPKKTEAGVIPIASRNSAGRLLINSLYLFPSFKNMKIGDCSKIHQSLLEILHPNLAQPSTFRNASAGHVPDDNSAENPKVPNQVECLDDRVPSAPDFSSELWHFKNLQLADDRCFEPHDVDILIGSELWPLIAENKKQNVGVHTPTALETAWIELQSRIIHNLM